jgi:TetR/AcrR family transcriptional regulator, tetracycline repressor protein
MRIQRDQVIAAALSLLDEGGLEGVTMRKLADALEVKAASLYWHFENKQALIDGMADVLVEGVARDLSEDQSWEDKLRQIAGGLRDALRARRDGARVYAGTYVVTDNVMRTGEAMIAACIRAGADTALAVDTAFSLLYFVLGFVMEEQALDLEGGINLHEREDAFMTLAKKGYPCSLEASRSIFNRDFDARFETGMELFIGGLTALLARRRKSAR